MREIILELPMVKNLRSKIGTSNHHIFECKAIFNLNSKSVEKPITGDNNKYFDYLKGKNCITLEEVAIGEETYSTKTLTCAYARESGSYYKCTSELSVRF